LQGGGGSLLLYGGGSRNNGIVIRESNNDIYFTTNNTGTKMTIASSGNVLIGSTIDSGPRLNIVRGNNTGSLFRIGNDDGTGTIYYFDFSRSASTGSLEIQGNQTGANNINLAPTSGNVLIGITTDLGYKLSVNGDVLATAFYESSDIRFKNVLETNPIIDVDGIEVIKFNRKDNASIRYGYSAQQVHEFVPDAVSGENELVVNYSDVHTLKIAALERRIIELENKLK
jgi:hypothetical protein